jgi:hypothetical protein
MRRGRDDCGFVKRSTEEDFSGGRISLAHQFPLIGGGQFLDRRLHSAGFRLVQAGELDEEPCRWICAGVASPSVGHVLCVTHRHIPSDTSVDCSAAAQDEVDIPALRRPCSRCQRARWWVRNGAQFFGISRDCSPPLPRTFPPDDQTPFRALRSIACARGAHQQSLRCSGARIGRLRVGDCVDASEACANLIRQPSS